MEKPKQLRCKKEYGAYIYRVGRHQIENLIEVKIAGKFHAVRHDLWLELVREEDEEYQVVSKRYFIAAKFAGVDIKVRLDELLRAGAEIFPVKFRPQPPAAPRKKGKARK